MFTVQYLFIRRLIQRQSMVKYLLMCAVRTVWPEFSQLPLKITEIWLILPPVSSVLWGKWSQDAVDFPRSHWTTICMLKSYALPKTYVNWEVSVSAWGKRLKHSLDNTTLQFYYNNRWLSNSSDGRWIFTSFHLGRWCIRVYLWDLDLSIRFKLIQLLFRERKRCKGVSGFNAWNIQKQAHNFKHDLALSKG